MKKVTALLVGWSIALSFALCGCSGGDTFTQKSYASGENEIEKITLQAEDREVEIDVSGDEKVYIDYFDGQKETIDITVSESKELTVKRVDHKKWTDFIGTKPAKEYRKIKIRIPDNRIASLTVDTTNEDITVHALSFTQHVSLAANGGNIVCERIRVGESVCLKTKNGNITGTVIGGWDDFSIACKIKKGKCNLPTLKEGGQKSFSADCNNGNIHVEFVQ
ncbi:MAG: DUF4097 domain-containing protein [Clostridia bacterium]|jgi:outer membrane lipoprotein SlyB|nr:DUF4097 domain-containing protein [Clostridia bacterium]